MYWRNWLRNINLEEWTFHEIREFLKWHLQVEMPRELLQEELRLVKVKSNEFSNR
jgi:hypothetical protein